MEETSVCVCPPCLTWVPGRQHFTLRNLDLAFSEKKHHRRRLDLALRRLQKEYDLIILDSPPTINILAENIFQAADYLIIPVIPSTLSVRSFEQLRDHLGEKRAAAGRILAFFSMVDARRNLHRQVMADMSSRYDGVLDTAIPYLSSIERMGLTREPVPARAKIPGRQSLPRTVG